MPWPFGSDSSKDNGSGRRPVSWADSLNGTDWEHVRTTRVVPRPLASLSGWLDQGEDADLRTF